MEDNQRNQLVELDYVPSWKEDGGSECIVGEQSSLCTEQKEQLEVLLQKYQDVFKVSLGKPKPSSTSYTLLMADPRSNILISYPMLTGRKSNKS